MSEQRSCARSFFCVRKELVVILVRRFNVLFDVF
jgi:hypothetical protein